MDAESRPRRTKIVGTIGPSSFAQGVIEDMIRAGLDVARLNFSHGTHDGHRKVAETIRRAEAATGKPIAIMQDLQGPKIRLGKLVAPITLAPGDEVVLSGLNDFVGEDARRLPTTYESLPYDVQIGERILLADGRLELSVVGVRDTEVACKVEVGGVISSSKGINLPGTRTSIPSLTDRDIEDLKFGLQLGVDYVALSFVRSPHDLTIIRDHMRRMGRIIPVISKIEKPQAVEFLEGIIDASDGIMVARGDLGVELPPEQVPTIQRRAIRMARERGKLTIVATQMLMSMTKHPRPTHAEVSDVANAVCDGTDAVMLSDETASGDYPVKSIEVMSALVASAETGDEPYEVPAFAESLRKSHAWAISRAAVVTAHELGAAAIVSYTHRGLGPRLMANWRPRCQILGCATTDEEVRRMTFYWGVRPLRIAPPSSIESLVTAAESVTLDRGILKRGETIVITSKMPLIENQATNILKLHTIANR
ncbi:MAG: pyruvate kinase [Deltaproteobacteria bacterium]|nr:pyruvate kinase [Deltaproteobacteria bacterium]